MAKKKNGKFKKALKKFFNSSQVIICTLIIFVGFLLWYTHYLTKVNKTYMFSGKSEYVTILNGVISLNYDINVLAGSDITYIPEKDLTVVKYKMGYYIGKDEDKLIEMVSKSGEDKEGLSLKGIVEELSAFNITEPYHNERFFSKEIINNLENGIYFIIEATTKDGTEILDKTTISLSKVSR